MKAILVEDELLIAKVLANNLTSLGYDVVGIATNGNDAMQLVKENSPDFVFMDIFIDGEWDGIETYKKMKEFSQAKVIYITANNDPFYKEKARDSGYTAFLTKPIEKVTLQKVLTLV